MRELIRYKGFTIDAEAIELHRLWTWLHWRIKDDGERAGPYIPERRERHHTAKSALTSAFKNGKKRIDADQLL
jgi:hypothetical protein